MLRCLLCYMALLVALPAVAATGMQDVDPWESFNRSVMRFNDQLDRFVMTPAAKGYQAVMPEVLDVGITNGFSMLGEIPSAGNAVLQGKPSGAGIALSRFLVNLTLGFFGLFDVATQLGIEQQKEDFGQTLAVWGVESGPYLVLPFFGPSTLRDGPSMLVDLWSDPLYVDHVPTRNTVYVVKYVDQRADLLKAEGLISGDRYGFIRDAYLQRRNYLIKDGKVVDNFGEDELDDDWLKSDEGF